ncbi:hypothetical protein [Mameliella sediminis]|uniref:hypothetical protein n=1 Tax=Mameliella sediminis TaxID=2836866 RepID=UPI001C450822|nr:hypothetical protein [Mameliella sediminis]MBY6114332.1 hypothetical protein [Antarctobacter heliothermus]MBY6143905.1 hypothetical protein [Mameliella alba]MBV7393187.1 hypothetical protein [Mameliella sediminis]MBY6163341.1 hypothetical protein [Mameliella alba]MBY6171604.1 hypothetical protein [Mameliella alba]
MKSAQDYLAEVIADADSMAVEDRITYLRDIVVPLIEYLGYALAHTPKDSVASSTFVLATDVEKRLLKLEQAVFETNDS